MNENTEILTPLQSLAEKALVVTFVGELQHNDITEEFKEMVRVALDSISLELNTDEDFDIAGKDIKACVEAEAMLSTLLKGIVSGNKDISEVTCDLEKMVSDFSGSRLILTKKVKDRKITLKKEITDAGKDELSRVIALSQLAKIFKPDNQIIDNAVKGRSSYDIMREIVTKAVVTQTADLAWMEVMYSANIAMLEASLVKFPGIYPDKGELAIEPTKTLKLIIGQREAEQALLLKEKADKEAAAKKAEDDRLAKVKADKEAADRIAKVEADRISEEQRKLADAIPEPVEQVVITEPVTTIPPPPPEWDSAPPISPSPFLNANITAKEIPLPPCFDDTPAITPAKAIQSFHNLPKEWITLYHEVNRMMLRLGADGEINAQQNEVADVMTALADIDGGQYN